MLLTIPSPDRTLSFQSLNPMHQLEGSESGSSAQLKTGLAEVATIGLGREPFTAPAESSNSSNVAGDSSISQEHVQRGTNHANGINNGVRVPSNYMNNNNMKRSFEECHGQGHQSTITGGACDSSNLSEMNSAAPSYRHNNHNNISMGDNGNITRTDGATTASGVPDGEDAMFRLAGARSTNASAPPAARGIHNGDPNVFMAYPPFNAQMMNDRLSNTMQQQQMMRVLAMGGSSGMGAGFPTNSRAVYQLNNHNSGVSMQQNMQQNMNQMVRDHGLPHQQQQMGATPEDNYERDQDEQSEAKRQRQLLNQDFDRQDHLRRQFRPSAFAAMPTQQFANYPGGYGAFNAFAHPGMMGSNPHSSMMFSQQQQQRNQQRMADMINSQEHQMLSQQQFLQQQGYAAYGISPTGGASRSGSDPSSIPSPQFAGLQDSHDHNPPSILANVNSGGKNSSNTQHFTQRNFRTLKTEADSIWLSEFLCFLRSDCCEVFIANAQDVVERRKSKQINLNQVGIRCRFCAHLAHNKRAGRSSCYPSSVDRIYQSVTMMIREHFPMCDEFPEEVRRRYVTLKKHTKKGEMESKTHWKNAAKELGMHDTERGIYFQSVEQSEEPEVSPQLDSLPEGVTEETFFPTLSECVAPESV